MNYFGGERGSKEKKTGEKCTHSERMGWGKGGEMGFGYKFWLVHLPPFFSFLFFSLLGYFLNFLYREVWGKKGDKIFTLSCIRLPKRKNEKERKRKEKKYNSYKTIEI